MFTTIKKRDGREVSYDRSKIEQAILKAMEAGGRTDAYSHAPELAASAEALLVGKFGSETPSVEDIQDVVETTLMDNGYPLIAKRYIIYRAERTRMREMNTRLMQIYDELTFTDAKDSDMKRDNANIDGDTAMGTMLKYGSEGAKDYYEKYILSPEQSTAHREGDIHIHDMDFYTLTTTCCQIDLEALFKDGFSTGHGFLREPNDIQSYAALACIAIQSNQNDQHGGQSVPNFDYALANGVKKTYKRLYASNFAKASEFAAPELKLSEQKMRDFIKGVEEETGHFPCMAGDDLYFERETAHFEDKISEETLKFLRDFANAHAETEVTRSTEQAMEALIHNLNTMHSRAGAQTPFSSINYGLDTSPEGRLVIHSVLKACEEGLGRGETAIFPIHIFRVKEGVSFNPEDPNYDLFRYACQVSAKRLFPNFSFIDAPFNLQYYKEGHPETEIAYMGCRTRVMANVYDTDNEISFGRGNLSFTTINLPRIAIKSKGNLDWFFEELERKLDLVSTQLLDRFKIQAAKQVKNYPFLMGQGVWIGTQGMHAEDEIAEILKHGTLSIGFIGLAECLVALMGTHHGESREAQNMGLEIIGFMRAYCDDLSRKLKLNVTLLATPAEGLSGRFVKIDRAKYGVLEGITDKEYYTNSFHVPVYYEIPAYEKINLEAPYHALTNAGHITYVELDGDTAQNVDAFETIIRAMKEAGIGYGSINHPVDRDPICGYTGIIADECPHCGREENERDPMERIRRITGYLVGTLDRFNDAKRAEERDRVKHGV